MQVMPCRSATGPPYPAAWAAAKSWKLAVAILAPATSDCPFDPAATGMANTLRPRIARPTKSGQRRAGRRAIVSFISYLRRSAAIHGGAYGEDRCETARSTSDERPNLGRATP